MLVNSQWRTCWCLIKNGQLWFYQDKGKNKVSQPAVTLEGCSVLPDPSPEHLYSFRIDMDGTQLATLEVDTRCLCSCFECRLVHHATTVKAGYNYSCLVVQIFPQLPLN